MYLCQCGCFAARLRPGKDKKKLHILTPVCSLACCSISLMYTRNSSAASIPLSTGVPV